MQQHRFREDLYYRLNVVHILLPNLRERPDDIPVLLEHFMKRVADEFGMPPVALDAAQLAGLCAKDWPGNVRELRNFVERTVLMGGPPEDEPAATADSAAPEVGGLPGRLDARAGQAGAHRARAGPESGQSLGDGAATGRVAQDAGAPAWPQRRAR